MNNRHRHALPTKVLAQYLGRRSSGAAGVHSDQFGREAGALAKNRQRTRAARRAAALRDQD